MTFPLPLTLQGDDSAAEFAATFEDFCRHRAQKRTPVTAEAARRLLAKCERWGAWYAALLLEIAIEKGWSSPHEPTNATWSDSAFRYYWRGGEFYYLPREVGA